MACDDATMRAFEQMIGPTGYPADRKRTAMVLREAKTEGCYPEVLAMVRQARAEWFTWLTLTQRQWQAKISRRPERGNHHDSWDIREKYVRAHNAADGFNNGTPANYGQDRWRAAHPEAFRGKVYVGQ